MPESPSSLAPPRERQPEFPSTDADSAEVPPSNPFAGYAIGTREEIPLGGYAALVGAYTTGLMAALRAVDRRDCSGLTAISTRDFVLLALATHKLARLVAKDTVTSPLRAPFVTYVEPAGAAEVREEPRGTGLRRAVGELLSCPICLAPWIGGALAFSLILRPKTARLVTNTFAAVALSDFLQHAYVLAKKAIEDEKDG